MKLVSNDLFKKILQSVLRHSIPKSQVKFSVILIQHYPPPVLTISSWKYWIKILWYCFENMIWKHFDTNLITTGKHTHTQHAQ